MKRVCCQNCGTQVIPVPNSLGEWPLEEVVAEDDRIRQLQYQAARAGIEYRHSVMIASNFSLGYGGKA